MYQIKTNITVFEMLLHCQNTLAPECPTSYAVRMTRFSENKISVIAPVTFETLEQIIKVFWLGVKMWRSYGK